MGHVPGRRLRAAALVAVTTALAATAASVTSGTALATSTSSSSGSASCTPDPGGCTFTDDGSATFDGDFDQPAVVVDASLCPPQATDPIDLVCGHFGIDPQVNGTVTASIAFDPDNDLDLCAYDATDTLITCSTGLGSTESITFAVTGGAVAHYEVRTLPISYPFPGPSPTAPVTYTGAVSFTAGGDGGGGTTTPTSCHKLNGGGKTDVVLTTDGHFSAHVDDDRCVDKRLKGKVRFASEGCDFRSTSVDDVAWDDATRTATITGMGRFKHQEDDPPVPFTATAHDGGPKSAGMDTFTIDKCDGGGAVGHGDIKYKEDTH